MATRARMIVEGIMVGVTTITTGGVVTRLRGHRRMEC